MMKELENTGERLVTSYYSYGTIEHLHRYVIASEHLKDNMIVLDIASGEGYGSYLLSKKAKAVYGVDISREAIEHAKEKYRAPNLSFINSDALHLPFESMYFDAIISFETLEHLVEHEKLILEFKRVLKSEGLLILSTPNKHYYSKDTPNAFHLRELDLEELNSLMKLHFQNIHYLHQKTIHSSLIYSKESSSLISQFAGDFDKITYQPIIDEADFIICFASDTKRIDLLLNNSIFDGNQVFINENLENMTIRNNYNKIVQNKIFIFMNKVLKRLGYRFI